MFDSSKSKATSGFSPFVKFKFDFVYEEMKKNFQVSVHPQLSKHFKLWSVLMIMVRGTTYPPFTCQFRIPQLANLDPPMKIIGGTEETMGQVICFKLGGSLTEAKCNGLLNTDRQTPPHDGAAALPLITSAVSTVNFPPIECP